MTTIAPPPPPAAPPAPGTPPPLTTRGRTAVRVALVMAATIVVIGSVFTLGAMAWGLSTFRVVADEKTLPTGTRSLIIDTGNVPTVLRLTADRDAQEPRISMRLINSRRSGDQTLDVSNDAQTTRVTINGGATDFMVDGMRDVTRWGRVGQVTVTLPPEMARRLSVTTKQDTGVLLAQADVDSLSARNGDGAVVLSGSARHMDIQTQDGPVVSREPLSVTDSFVAESNQGDVTIEFKDTAPATIEASTRDGDVEISLGDPGPFLVRASGDSTRIRVPETNDPARAAAEVTVRSDGGDVVVEQLGRHR